MYLEKKESLEKYKKYWSFDLKVAIINDLKKAHTSSLENQDNDNDQDGDNVYTWCLIRSIESLINR